MPVLLAGVELLVDSQPLQDAPDPAHRLHAFHATGARHLLLAAGAQQWDQPALEALLREAGWRPGRMRAAGALMVATAEAA